MTRELFNASAVAQLAIEPMSDRVVACNEEACSLLKIQRSELLAQRVSVLFADCFPQLLVFTEEVLVHGKAWSDQLVTVSASQPIALEVSARTGQIDNQTYLFLALNSLTELAERRDRSEAQRHYLSGIGHWNQVSRVFQEFERENQLILDAVGEGIYGVDANGVTTFVNPAAQRILGYSAEQLAGKNMHTMVHHSHGDGSHFHAETCPIYAAFRDGTVHTVDDDVFWTKSGKQVNVEYTSTPIRDNDKIVGAVVVFRDVSQKRADEKRLLAALNEIQQLTTRLELENAYLIEEINSEFNHHRIVGKSPAVQNIVRQIELVAPTDATVLIHGESGTGKELIARAIHDISACSNRSLIRVNCAAIPADLFESEFFGHKKGAFTGATHDRTGRFELADGGTLFLDEVGEIPLHLQGKLLRVLQEQQFERVGDTATRKVNVRIIAATNKDLKDSVAQGLFREDLYFRLNVFPIESVPLRHRKEDIELLTQHFLQRCRSQLHKQDLKVPLSELEKLKAYHWPGNIRELENVIERHSILAQDDMLRFDGLHIDISQEDTRPSSSTKVQALLTEDQVREQELQRVHRALARCRGKISGPGGAAQMLGVKPTTLSSRIKKLQIDLRKYKDSTPLTEPQ